MIQTNIEDFIKTYYLAFKNMYNISELDLIEIYNEDIYKGQPYTEGGSAWDSEMKALYCAIRLKKPKNILEIGNYKGSSTNHILLAAEKNNNNPTVCLVDIQEQLDYKRLHNTKFIRILLDSIKFLEEHKNLNFDFIAQDGWHTYEHVKKELDLITGKTITELDIWSHDYFISPTKYNDYIDVKKAWEETKDNPQITYFFPMIDSVSECGIVLGRILPKYE